ncbi:MAG: hypothetical protein WBL88_09305 [Nitrososphaeraceae archaeon]
MPAYLTDLDTNFGALFFPEYDYRDFVYPPKNEFGRYHFDLKFAHYKLQPKNSEDAITMTKKWFLTCYLKLQKKATQKQVQQPSSLPKSVTTQNPSVSTPAPNSPVNRQSMPHQIVIALPLKQGGKIWTGSVIFAASKPIEIEIEPGIIPSAKDALYSAKWIDITTPPTLNFICFATSGS